MPVFISWAARLASLFCNVLLMRGMIQIMGIDGYAALCILISVSSWFVLIDFGIGYSLQNFLSEHQDNSSAKAELRYTAGLILVGITTLLSLAAFALYQDFARLLLPATTLQQDLFEVQSAGVLYCSLFSILIGAGTAASKIWYAEHRGFIPIICAAVATLASLALAEALVYSGHPVSLPLGCLVYFGPLASVMIYGLVIKTGLVSRSSNWSTPFAKSILRRGRHFWLFGLAATLTLQIDNLILARYVSAEEVVVYNVAMKIVYAGLTFYSLALGLLHPRMAEYLSSNRAPEVTHRISQMIGIGFLFCIVAAGCIFFLSHYIVQFMSPGLDDPSLFFKWLLVLYIVVRVWTDAHTVVLMSASKMSGLVISTLMHGIASALMMIFLVPAYGANGVLLALIGSYVITNAWYTPYLCKAKLDVRFSVRHIASSTPP